MVLGQFGCLAETPVVVAYFPTQKRGNPHGPILAKLSFRTGFQWEGRTLVEVVALEKGTQLGALSSMIMGLQGGYLLDKPRIGPQQGFSSGIMGVFVDWCYPSRNTAGTFALGDKAPQTLLHCPLRKIVEVCALCILSEPLHFFF